MKGKYMAYVGSYSYTGKAKGITVFDVDVEAGTFKERCEVEVDNSSYVIASSDGKTLYSIADEGVVSFRILENGSLARLNSASIRGMRGCHLCTDKEDKYVFVSGYHDGKTTVLSLNPDGSVGNIVDGVFDKGYGSVAERNFRPHVTCTRRTPDGRFVMSVDNGIDQTAPVEYYTLGQEVWKTAENWPVPETRVTHLYLDSDGHANTSAGDGRLTFAKPEREDCDGYAYDPENPSQHIIDMSENEIEVPEDYTREELRQDLLCYTSPVLKEDLVLTGDMTAELYISSDAPDTDFVVRVTDVDENGRSIKLADGLLSARYRNGFARSEFLQEGEIVCLKIRTTKLSNCFRKGHRIRVTVTSSAKNFIFPNSNTREGFASARTVVAHNRVYHGGLHASRLTVRVEP